MKLISAKDINKTLFGSAGSNYTYALTTSELQEVLAKLGVKPEAKAGLVVYYDDTKVMRVLDKIKKPKRTPPVTPAVAKVAAPPTTTESCGFDQINFLTDLDHRLYTLIHAEFEEPLSKVATLVSGNQELFKSIQQLQKYVTDRLDTIETSMLLRLERIEAGINNVATLGASTIMYNPCGTPDKEPEPAPVPEKHKAVRKPHIGIIGMNSSVTPIINREFGDVFKLQLLESDERNRIAGLKNCDAVFLLRGRVSSNHVDSLRRAGAPKGREIGSGIDSIRDALTNYFVEVGK